MKKIIALVMLVMLTSTFAYCANNELKDVKSQINASWRQLKSGMTESQVRSILGEPSRVEVQPYTNKKEWEYENFGTVTFDNENDFFGRYVVTAWSEPRKLDLYKAAPNESASNTDMPLDLIGLGIIILLALLFIMFYFLPSIIAGSKRKRNTGAIFALNLLLGWTFLGWVIAFIWSLTHDS